MQKIKIITTVGTSIYENYLKDKSVSESKSDFRNDYNILKEEANPYSKYGSLKDVLDELGEIISSWFPNNPNASAEIKSVLKIKEQTAGEVEVHLIATDTALSVKAAELVKDWLKLNSIVVNEKIEIIEGLGVENANDFIEKGVQNLIDKVLNIHESNNNEYSVLNISGGYKAMIPVLTIVGQLYDIPLSYIYENSEKIIEMNPMPVSFDWFAIEKYTILLHKTAAARSNDRVKETVREMIDQHLVNPDTLELTLLGNLLKQYLEKRSSPFTGTMMGYFMEHKLYKYYQEEFGRMNVEHSYAPIKKFEDGKPFGDIDLLIQKEEGFIPIEIKPSNVYQDGFGTWEKLLDVFPKRIRTVLQYQEKPLAESWLILYGEHQPNAEFLSEMANALSDLDRPIKAFFVKITPSKRQKERHIYQDFMKDDIKQEMITEIYNSNNNNHV